MARKTSQPKTYSTSPAFLALSKDEQFDLVIAAAGNGTELASDAEGRTELLPVELEDGRSLNAIVSWTPEGDAYEVYPTFTVRS